MKEIEAGKIVLKGKNGEIKAILDATHPGAAMSFDIFGGSGAVISISTDVQGTPKVAIRDDKHVTRLALGIDDNGDVGIAVNDKSGRLKGLLHHRTQDESLSLSIFRDGQLAKQFKA